MFAARLYGGFECLFDQFDVVCVLEEMRRPRLLEALKYGQGLLVHIKPFRRDVVRNTVERVAIVMLDCRLRVDSAVPILITIKVTAT